MDGIPGDLATMDDDGYPCNRRAYQGHGHPRSGENVYPREIEEFLYTHPDIVDAQVIGVPDERYGEELMAWIRPPFPGAPELTIDAVRGVLRGEASRMTKFFATSTSWTSSR